LTIKVKRLNQCIDKTIFPVLKNCFGIFPSKWQIYGKIFIPKPFLDPSLILCLRYKRMDHKKCLSWLMIYILLPELSRVLPIILSNMVISFEYGMSRIGESFDSI